MKNKIFKLAVLFLAVSALAFSLFALTGGSDEIAPEKSTLVASFDEVFLTENGLPTGDLPPLRTFDIPADEADLPAPPDDPELSPSKSLNSAADPLPGGSRSGYNYLATTVNGARYTGIYKLLVTYCENLIASTATVEYSYSYTSIYKNYGYFENIGSPGSISFGALGPLSADELDLVWELFFLDNPQYFFVAPWFFGRTAAIGGGYSGVMPFIPQEFFTPQQRKNALTNLETRYQEYASYVAAGSSSESAVVIARLVHDKIIAERDYAYYNNAADAHQYAHTIAGVMDLSTIGPVCESYAKAYSYILTRLGVANSVQVGIGGGGGHAWNTVEIGGQSYFVDTTWDDGDTTKGDVGNRKNGISLEFFLVGTNSTWFTSSHEASDLDPSTYWTVGGQYADWYNLVPSNLAPSVYTLPTPGYIYLSDALFYGNRVSPLVRLSYSETDSRPTSSVIYNLGQFTLVEGANPGNVVPYLYKWTNPGSPQYSSVKYTRGTDYTVRPVLYENLANGYSRYRLWIDGKGGTVRGTDFFFADILFVKPKATASTGIVGIQGQTVSATITLSIENATLKTAGFTNIDAAGWFSFEKTGGLCGLTARATANPVANTVTITVSGTASAFNAEYFTITVPAQYFVDGTAASTPLSGSGAAYIAISSSANQLLPSLRVLDVSDTSIADLDFLAYYKDVEELYIKANTKLTDLAGIIHLRKLAVLSLPKSLQGNSTVAFWISLLPGSPTVQWQ
ncbi:MAG: hypothetical protein LBO63_08710 [Oscillospiraceae bacterium]|jgi:hypothetical protein|nr:hypothetical protein [Oscillospiraceae bacterium]